MRYINAADSAKTSKESPLSLSHVLADPAASVWLKDMLRSGDARDIVDVLNDLELAYLVFRDKHETMTAKAETELHDLAGLEREQLDAKKSGLE